ncbi:MAG: helix-turn-helix transcriptional regulator [Pontiellaceae bacterium]|nr:helix-turn-helix transcriptional regulator [Pontiellaceae bacterium]
MNGKNITGARVAKLRKELGMTQSDLMKALAKQEVHIRRTDITKLEIGTRCVRDYEVLAVSKILKTTPQYLLTGRGK